MADYYEKQKAEEFIQEKVKQIIGAMELLEIDANKFASISNRCIV